MQVIETALEGVRLIAPVVHRDGRGYFVETWREDRFRQAGISDRFVQDNQSRSTRDTLRGLHWQWRRPQAKLVRVLAGSIYDVVVDVRRGSPAFGKWLGVELTADPLQWLYVPVGYAHGFCVLSEVAEVEYKCSDVYDPGGEAGLPWDDPSVRVEWPTTAPVLSARDLAHPPLTRNRTDLL